MAPIKTSRKPGAGTATGRVRKDAKGRTVIAVTIQGTLLSWEGKTTWTAAERRALVQRVIDGEKTALPELRAMFHAHPDAAMQMWDPARTLHYDLAAANSEDPLFPELAMARADALRRELEGEHPTALERLLCERAATCWLVSHFLEVQIAGGVSADGRPVSVAWQEQHDRMVTRAHDRYLSALLTLAKVRRLLRPGPDIAQMNIAQPGAQQVNLVAEASPQMALSSGE